MSNGLGYRGRRQVDSTGDLEGRGRNVPLEELHLREIMRRRGVVGTGYPFLKVVKDVGVFEVEGQRTDTY